MEALRESLANTQLVGYHRVLCVSKEYLGDERQRSSNISDTKEDKFVG